MKVRNIIIAGVISCLSMGAYANEIPKPNVKADTYIVVDHETGAVIAESNSNKPRGIASLTKLMTAYAVFKEIENGTLHLEDTVKVSKKAWRTTGSKMFIEVGQTVSVGKLIQGLIIISGNDAAVALAEHISGSEDEFTKLMNAYAKTLKMENTAFWNATGLPNRSGKPDNYASALDISILSRAILKEFPEHYKNFKVKNFTYDNISQDNRNALLSLSPSYDGFKTGYTIKAKYCLSASFLKDDRRIVTIVLGAKTSKDRFSSAKALTNYGYRRFENVTPITEGMVMHKMPVYYGEKDSIDVVPAESFTLTTPKPLTSELDERDITLTAYFDSNGEGQGTMLFAPVEQAYVVGRLDVSYKGEVVKQIPLITRETVKKGSWIKKVKDWVRLKVSPPEIN